MLHLILGGARSGKSQHAESIAQAQAHPVTYIATAQALDEEMQRRVQHHQQRRPSEWRVIEEPIALAQQLELIDQPQQLILVDCLTLWLSNLLLLDNPDGQLIECDNLLQLLPKLYSDIILVSNETGLGIVPMGEITRRFVDESGRLHQRLGKIADKVEFCVAGFPMLLKGEKS
ncbi:MULTISPECIES: bifunctional adenosylcobinamide kinase/adenosylcobinamide-phosphate guanylyltransferase [unclassified Acinetobacter]|uniref:bifunctional adenosylcobinamide kinase/adenosylcobinamide-phosphate guanylyltransferase n=1 Tax=unclassified Acinetobacter TaxID=196816 RepID=UPI001909BDAC|nr:MULTISPECIES: bifunctional adenosylcobinamide kinase/adenosylcobinamide-phosphate guanylyltransferase [unclassified Acinetobacter]MBK0063207.1 bifunctional adenosylcobinamide kinase/adenosylcobinamide-phosphate guanylyltransferase [Acinetobacter sp. S55]MBK0066881.1 bifunctional adenosylcobinamide kinase/adenosylcobinamide-phosphate guanylyltransferase [Acinetobacter sp. S54]